MNLRERSDLDRHITGNYGEDFGDDTEPSAEAVQRPTSETERLITAIFDAADQPLTLARDRALGAAIDAALTSAYGEGRADEREEWVGMTLRVMGKQ